MDSDTRDNIGNALLSLKQQVGFPDELVTKNNQNISGSDTKWSQIFRDKDIRHILTEPYRNWRIAMQEKSYPEDYSETTVSLYH